MKEIFENVLVVIVAIVTIILITVWSVMIGLIGGLVTTIVFAFNHEKANAIYNQYKEILVLPYKIMGVCNNWDEYTWWVKFTHL